MGNGLNGLLGQTVQLTVHKSANVNVRSQCVKDLVQIVPVRVHKLKIALVDNAFLVSFTVI